jgi:hypothetical protein
MMEPSSAFPGLEDLVDLGSDTEIDMRPTLLRVLTDLYLQRPTHTPEDERYYTALALRLIDAADLGTRAALAARLATYAAAPPQVLLRLARDQIEVAAPILKQSGVPSRDDLAAIAAEFGGMHAELIAARRVDDGAPSRASELLEQDAAGEALQLSELFFAAGASERRWILINLDYAPILACDAPVVMQRQDVWRLETAALQHNTEAVLREFGRALGLSRHAVSRILDDQSGEPLVVAAKAVNIPADVLQRMLLFINAGLGHSVDRVYELAHLFGEMSVASARRMLTVWREADAPVNSRMRSESAGWRAAAESARRALSEVSRRPALTRGLRVRSMKC